jgi:hypothetical protein
MDQSGEKFPQQPVSRLGNRKMAAGAQAVRHRYDSAVNIGLTIADPVDHAPTPVIASSREAPAPGGFTFRPQRGKFMISSLY